MKFIVQQKQTLGVSVVKMLEKSLGGYRPARSYSTIHASMLTSPTAFCPREVVLSKLLGRKPKDEYVGFAMQVAFDNGQALHELLRETWLASIAVGTWVCLGCKTEVPFSKKPKGPCGVCDRNLWRYKEETFRSQTTGATGSLDVLLDLGMGKHTMVEVKSMDKDQFNELKAPLAEHRARTNVYMFLVKDSGRPEAERINTDVAKILYISKGFGQKNEDGYVSPFKEYDVYYQEATAMPYINKAKAVHIYRTEGGPIPGQICATAFTTRAKSCCCPVECFSPKYTQVEA